MNSRRRKFGLILCLLAIVSAVLQPALMPSSSVVLAQGDDGQSQVFGVAEKTIALSRTPQTVLNAARAAVPAAKFTETVVEIAPNGRTIYQVTGENAIGRPLQVDVSRLGLILEIEEWILLPELPLAVRTVMTDWLPKFEPTTHERRIRPDGIVYQLGAKDARGREVAVEIPAGGQWLIMGLDTGAGLAPATDGFAPGDNLPTQLFGVADRKIPVSDVPQPVQIAASTAAGGASFDAAAVEIARDGTTVYQMTGKNAAGRAVEVDLTIGGLILEIEFEWIFAQLPRLIRDPLGVWLPGFAPTRIEQSIRPDGIVYQLAGKDGEGQDISVEIPAGGQRLSIELDEAKPLNLAGVPAPFGVAEMAFDDLSLVPQMVMNAARTAASDVKFDSAVLEIGLDGNAVYQMIGKNENGLAEVDVTSIGRILGLEFEWPFAKLPQEVLGAVNTWLPNFQPTSVEQSISPSGILYQLGGVDAKGQEIALEIQPDGQSLTIGLDTGAGLQPAANGLSMPGTLPTQLFGVAEKEIPFSDVPQAVKHAAMTAVGEAASLNNAVVEIAADGTTIYQLMGKTVDLRPFEVDVSRLGLIWEFEWWWSSFPTVPKLPAPVQSALDLWLPGFQTEIVELSIRPHGIVYQLAGKDSKNQQLTVEIPEGGERLTVQVEQAVAGAVVPSLAPFGVAERVIALSETPPAVLNAARTVAQGVTFRDTLVEIAPDGNVTYQVRGVHNDTKRAVEVDVSSFGLIWDLEFEWLFAELPVPVLEAVNTWLPDNIQRTTVEQSIRPDGILYTLTGTDSQKREISVQVPANGQSLTIGLDAGAGLLAGTAVGNPGNVSMELFGVAEQKIPFENVPKEVHIAAETAAAGATADGGTSAPAVVKFDEVILEIAQDGTAVYQMMGKTADLRPFEVDVSRLGLIWEFEWWWSSFPTVPKLPAPVQNALDVWQPGFKATQVEQRIRPDGVVYQLAGTDSQKREISLEIPAHAQWLTIELFDLEPFFFTAPPAPFGVAEQTITDLKTIPEDVRIAAETAGGGATFSEAVVEIGADGQTVYQVQGKTADQRPFEVDVSALGLIWEFEWWWSLFPTVPKLPTLVQRALDTWQPGFEPATVEQRIRPDGVVYQLSGLDVKGQEVAIEIPANGRRVDVEPESAEGLVPSDTGRAPAGKMPTRVFGVAEREIPLSDVPQTVKNAAMTAAGKDASFGDEAVVEITADGSAIFQILGKAANGNPFEVDVSRLGLIWEFEWWEWLFPTVPTLPTPVQGALAAWQPGFKVIQFEKSIRPDGIVYQFSGINAKGQRASFEIPADGQRLSLAEVAIAGVTAQPLAETTLEYSDTSGKTTQVEVPAAAVTGETDLLYTETISPTVSLPRFSFAGRSFTLEAFRNGNKLEDFEFAKGVLVTLNYNDDDTGGIHEETLKLFHWTGSAWTDAACGPYVRDLEGNGLSVPICHLSEFALFGVSNHQEIFVPVIER